MSPVPRLPWPERAGSPAPTHLTKHPSPPPLRLLEKPRAHSRAPSVALGPVATAGGPLSAPRLRAPGSPATARPHARADGDTNMGPLESRKHTGDQPAMLGLLVKPPLKRKKRMSLDKPAGDPPAPAGHAAQRQSVNTRLVCACRAPAPRLPSLFTV